MEDVKLQDKIREFLSIDTGSGSLYGYGSGYWYMDGEGHGDGTGSGDGGVDGSGHGHGYGSGDGGGAGSGHGIGYGSGDGGVDGSGHGNGYGSGDGYGYGFGSENGIGQINGMHIYRIDDVPTIITSVKGNIAKGFILQSDLTQTPCYVVKGNNLFAHGEDLHQAMAALTDKMFDHMPEEERIGEFVKAHPEYRRPYSNKDLYEWHHRLTGSCMAGRNAFVKDRGLTLEGETTVEEFVKLTKNAYGGQTIRKLPERYKESG